ncbi:MAG TPA: archaeosortase/exosortase family protein [Candidatus Acidoferrales bacterium]|nr:archaeosortase/exosortase family protein [Candidatus Acidoferrales bacterium]
MFSSLPKFLSDNPFYIRVFLFLVLFIVVSGIIGPWVIGTRLLYGFYFFIYGNMGKMVLFSAIAFYLLTRGRRKDTRHMTYEKRNLWFIVASFVSLGLFFPIAKSLLTQPSFYSDLPLSLLAHALVIAVPVLLAFGVFGASFLKKFIKKFKKELLLCLGMSVAFYFAIFYVWQLWPYLSALVLHIEYALFSLSFNNVHIIPPRTLFVQNFGVTIEQACSGLDSLFLFTALYLFIGILDWKVFNHKKLVGMFFVAGIGTFIVNILRIYLLILGGVFISPVLTAQLFHTYLGMVLFIIYFALFWRLFYGWMKR